MCEWLPEKIKFKDFRHNWIDYVEALYQCYLADFITYRPAFRGITLGVKRHPQSDGKDATFWHIIQEGDNEQDRIPEFSRCERIKWPRPIIENESRASIKVWENERRGERRVCIWYEAAEYLVILAARSTYTLFWTAYPVTEDHRKRKLQKEYLAWKKAEAAH